MRFQRPTSARPRTFLPAGSVFAAPCGPAAPSWANACEENRRVVATAAAWMIRRMTLVGMRGGRWGSDWGSEWGSDSGSDPESDPHSDPQSDPHYTCRTNGPLGIDCIQ